MLVRITSLAPAAAEETAGTGALVLRRRAVAWARRTRTPDTTGPGVGLERRGRATSPASRAWAPGISRAPGYRAHGETQVIRAGAAKGVRARRGAATSRPPTRS